MNKFPKTEKLCKFSHIQKLFSQGKAIKSSSVKMIYTPIQTECGTPVQVLFSVPKRNFKKAVVRNLLKRRMREAFRLQKRLFYVQDHQFALGFLYLGKEILSYKEIFEIFKNLADNFEKINSEESNDNQ